MRLRARTPAERCPYCHDALGAGARVECSACRAVYHAECATLCVTLGCKGPLVRAAKVEIGIDRALARVRAGILIAFALAPIAIGAFAASAVLGGIAAAIAWPLTLAIAVCLVPQDDPRPRVVLRSHHSERASRVEPTPTTSSRAPSVFPEILGGAPPIVEASSDADAAERMLRQRESLRDRRGGPGLGRTI